MFNNFDFNRLNDPSFKESDVREEIIMPLLNELGYQGENIIREMPLKSNVVREGSKDKIISIYPDYVLKDKDKIICVLDAKSPRESIIDNDHIGQVFSYAMHSEVQTSICILCNGREIAVFKIPKREPILIFSLQEIDTYFEELKSIILPSNTNTKKSSLSSPKKIIEDYMSLNLPEPIHKPKKQAKKRHFGVHGYFTKQSWDIVQKHILNFTAPNDIVLDPFGGSGVTFTESLITQRIAIHIDLNPLSVFWVNALFTKATEEELLSAVSSILKQFEKQRPKNDKEIKNILETVQLPKNIEIKEKGSDVDFLYELFTEKQMAELALLKSLIKNQNQNIIECLMLAFSSTVTKINRTFHYTKSTGGGDCSAFRYYRFRIAKTLTELNVASVFKHKCSLLIKAKQEIKVYLNDKILEKSKILKGDATTLLLENESVDYIYTDPPYGSKIPYLDLSAMWNAWLDLDVTEEDYQKEAIEGGSLNKKSEEYQDLIKKSINEMFRVLKWDRWMSFVFQHQDPKYWHLIVDTAERVGFEYAGCRRYSNGQTSFKKRQNPFSVLSGQLIIYFKKKQNPKTLLKHELGANITDIIINNIEALIVKEHGATLEDIYNELIVQSLELGFLDILSKEHSDMTPLLNEYFNFDQQTEKYHIKKDTRFKSHIPLELRILYFLKSYLQRQNRENNYPTFDDIVFDIMPMLKNGVTPEEQSIKNVLEHIAIHKNDGWVLKVAEPTLFDEIL